MRIIKKPKIKPITCPQCGCVFKPTKSGDLGHLLPGGGLFTRCPMCKKESPVNFKETHKGEKER